MDDNPRYILYQSDYEAVCANKADNPKDMTVTIAGKCCESGDLIQENAPVQTLEPGDILAVLSTGLIIIQCLPTITGSPALLS